jgi:hypothetical protein
MLTSDFSILDCLWPKMCFQWLREGQLFSSHSVKM